MISGLELERGCICLGIPSMPLTFSVLVAAQATKTSLAYCAALRQAVKAQGDAQLLILNPGNVLDKGLAKQVHSATAPDCTHRGCQISEVADGGLQRHMIERSRDCRQPADRCAHRQCLSCGRIQPAGEERGTLTLAEKGTRNPAIEC